jgi:hypothetical protein
MIRKLLLGCLFASAVACLPGVAAHGINSQGVAVEGDQAFRAWVSADPVPGDDPQLYQCRVLVVDAVTGGSVVDVAFRCRSNLDHDNLTNLAYVGAELFADGAESNTDFRIDGVQHGPVVHATGHYLDLQLAVSINLLPA